MNQFFQPVDDDLKDGPKQIHLSYSYSDSEMPVDEAIVRRIRFDADPTFVPMFKTEVWQYATGGTRKFVHWGYGCEHSDKTPILDPEIFAAPKPHFGYLSTLGRCAFVSPWVQGPPFLPMSLDETPGDTVPFDERAYTHAIDCLQEMKRRVARAEKLRGVGDTDENTIPGVRDDVRQMAYRALTTTRKERMEAAKRDKDAAFEKVRYVLKGDKPIHQSFLDLTDDDRGLMAEFWRRDGDRKNAMSLTVGRNFQPIPKSPPANPGRIVVVPN